MKIMHKIMVAIAFCAAIIVQTDSFARSVGAVSSATKNEVVEIADEDDFNAVIEDQTEEVIQATDDFNAVKAAVEVAISDAEQAYEDGELSLLQKSQIIGEQNYKLAKAQEQLNMVVAEGTGTVKAAEGYFDRFISGARSLFAPSSSSNENKDKAKAIVSQLKMDLDQITQTYQEDLQEASDDEKEELTEQYNSVKQEFENEINKQSLLGENQTILGKKSFWTAVGVAGAALGGAIAAKKYYDSGATVPAGTPVSVSKEVKLESGPVLEQQRPTLANIMMTQDEQEVVNQDQGAGIIANLPGNPLSSISNFEVQQKRAQDAQAAAKAEQERLEEQAAEQERIKEARVANDADIAEKNKAKVERGLTKSQLEGTGNVPKTPLNVGYAGSGTQGFIKKRAEDKNTTQETANLKKELATEQAALDTSNTALPKQEAIVAKEQAKLDALEKKGMSAATLNQRSVVSEANKSLNRLQAGAVRESATIEKLQSKLPVPQSASQAVSATVEMPSEADTQAAIDSAKARVASSKAEVDKLVDTVNRLNSDIKIASAEDLEGLKAEKKARILPDLQNARRNLTAANKQLREAERNAKK